jgi:hypothetical protein
MTKSEIPSLALQTLFQALSWLLDSNTSLLPKSHPNLKIPRRNSIKFYPNSNLEISLNFHTIHLESEEVPMEKVVPLFKPFKTIFHFKFFEQVKVLFRSAKVWKI